MELENDITIRRFCPICAAPLRATKRSSIVWDDSKKQFQVYLSFVCLYQDSWKEDVLVKELPLVIAEGSLCSCGSPLSLSNYRIQKTEDDIEFEGIYLCSQCNSQQKPLFQRIKQGLEGIWKDTTAVEVGPTGIKYQKKNG